MPTAIDRPPSCRPGRAACLAAALLAMSVTAMGCGYHHYAGSLEPAPEQAEGMVIADDNSVTFTQGRLEVRVRPMTDDGLNRQFASQSVGGPHATNPFTYSDQEFYEGKKKRQRFTVFSLGVKNYAYPKVRIDPERVQLMADNGRIYWSLSVEQLDAYYRTYAIGYQGNEYSRYRERRDLINRMLLGDDVIFSGQEAEGFLVFPALHPDVRRIRLFVHDLVLRFDYRDEPVETVTIAYDFEREVGREYPDGTVELTAKD